MDLSQALEIASHTDPGMVRSHNEDSIASVPDKGLVVLADGMGGYNAGEVASGMATTVLTTELRQQLDEHAPNEVDPQSGEKAALKMLQQQIAKANTSIYQAAQSQPQYAGMGTTLVVALFYDNKVMVAHIGDSRLYRMRGSEFSQVSKDHSLLQEQIDAGMLTPEQAKHSSNKNLVTRALGIDPAVEPEIHEYDTQVRRHLFAVLGRFVRYGERRGYRHDAAGARGQPESGGTAIGADGQRQRRARQRVGDPDKGLARIPGRTGLGIENFRMV